MADVFQTVTPPDLPALAQVDGSELVAVWRNGRLAKMPQRDLRGTKTFSGPSTPPYEASRLFAMQVSLNDRWRNTTSRDEHKLISLDPIVWDFDGNVGGGKGEKGEPGSGISPKGQFATTSDLPAMGLPGDLYVATADDTAQPPAFLAGEGAMYVATGGTFGPGNRYRNIGPFRGPQGEAGAKTVAALEDATEAFKGLNVDNPADPGTAVGDKIASETTTIRQGSLTRSRRTNTKTLDRPDLRDWSGVDLTGQNASTTSCQAAFSQTSAAGYTLNFPEGILAIDAPLTAPNGLRLRGQGTEIGGGISGAPGRGTWLRIAHSGKGFVLTNVAGRGSIINRIGMFRDQNPIGSSFTPANHDYDFDVTADDVVLEDIFCQNPTKLLRISGGAGRVSINRLRGQPLVTGIEFAGNLDTCRLDNIHLWPFWSQDRKVYDWMLANADAYVLRRTDNPMFGKLFALGYRSAIRLQSQTGTYAGGASKVKIDQLDADYCASAIIFDADTANCEVGIAQFSTEQPDFYTAPQYQAIVAGSGNTLWLGKARFDGGRGGCLRITEGANNTAILGNPRIDEWNLSGTNMAAFAASGTGNKIALQGEILAGPGGSASLKAGNVTINGVL